VYHLFTCAVEEANTCFTDQVSEFLVLSSESENCGVKSISSISSQFITRRRRGGEGEEGRGGE
jgi:hypothetical protein